MASSPPDRDRIADERDRTADERERRADKREQEADERDRQAEVRERDAAAAAAPTGDSRPTVDGLFGIDLGHRGVRTDETELDDDEAPPVRGSARTKTLTERLANAAADRDRAPLPPGEEDDEVLDSED